MKGSEVEVGLRMFGWIAGGFWDWRDGVHGYNEGLDLGMMPDKGN